MSWSETDEKFMRAAIGEAKVAASVNEVPVGAVLV
jgi:tRNA(Arg) A34 adenosine deaminase TadA